MEPSSSDAGGLLGPGMRDFIAGAVAGAFAITVSQPLDTVRVRIQQACASGGVPSTLSVLSSMVRKEGLLSPWKGLTYPLLFASVQSAILFQAYGWTLRQLASPDPDDPAEQRQQQQQQQPEQSSQNAEDLQALSVVAGSLGSSSGSGVGGGGGGGAPLAQHQTQHLSGPRHQHHQHQSQQQHQHQSQQQHQHQSQQQHQHQPQQQNQLHLLHLHHHHHAVSQRMRETEVHGPTSVTGRVVSFIASSLGLEASGLTGSGAPGQGPSSSSGSERSASEGAGGGSSRGLVEAAAGAGQDGGQGLREEAERPQPIPTPWHGFVAGGVAGMAQVFLWSPVELLKLRAQLQTASPGSAGYRNPAALAAQVLRQDGVAGLYRGFTLTVVRDVPSYAMYFWLYHDIAAALNPGIHPEQAPPATQVLAGGLAGVLAWLPIYPLDVIKTRVQAVSSAASTKTWWQHTQELRSERALYRGCLPTLVRAFMMDGASFLGYTTTLRLLAAGAAGGAGGGGGGGNSST